MGVEPTGKSPNGSENSALDQSAKLTRRRLCNSITILKTGLVCVCVFAGGGVRSPELATFCRNAILYFLCFRGRADRPATRV